MKVYPKKVVSMGILRREMTFKVEFEQVGKGQRSV